MSSNSEWAFPLPTAKAFSANFLAVPIPPKFCAIQYSVDVIIITFYVRIDYDGSIINVPVVFIIIPLPEGHQL